VVQLLPLPKESSGRSIGLLSSDGRFKRLAIEEFQDLSGRAASVVKMKEGVTLKKALVCNKEDNLVIATTIGRLLRIADVEKVLPVMGRASQGAEMLMLLPGEEIVSCICDTEDTFIHGISARGLYMRLQLGSLPARSRGSVGAMSPVRIDSGDKLLQLQETTSSLLCMQTREGKRARLLVTDEIVERQRICLNSELTDAFFPILK